LSDLDDIARLVNPVADQGQAAARTWAEQVAAYYRTLRSRGVGIDSATCLTRDYQGILLQHGMARLLLDGGQ
jgi:hypothetical protein